MGELRAIFMSAKAAANVDPDKGGNVGDRKAVAGDELVSLQFVIHSFEALINNRTLRLAIFWGTA